MEDTTDSLRVLAPRWSLAGDQKLLDLLQNMHQKIVTKCQEVNTKLDEMTSSLDTTSINLQNVNNKFMALSNSQFIESRVYEDDADVTMETKPEEVSQITEVPDELEMMKQSLAILDATHETAEIIDDTDSDDSDAAISVFLKPKDAYAHRPLPYIIGSQAWKNKWHAGLVVEDSDSDSSTSRRHGADPEQYSESDDDVQTDRHVRDNTISETSSSFHSERDKDLSSVPDKKQTPADVAAEIAARLGLAPPSVLEEPEEDVPQPTPKPVYRPQKPISSTIFSDEPPPLDSTYDQYSSESQDDDDIFAEINKKQPYNNSNKAQNSLADDLFGRPVFNEDFSDYKEPKSAKQKPTLFAEESEPELFVEKTPKPKEIQKRIVDDDNTIKKPVGGISLFGSNKGTENIGAAILNRNRRKSTSSDKDSSTNKNIIKNDAADNDSEEGEHNANYIFDNLFAKAKQAEQKMAKPVTVDRPVKKDKPKEVKDIFSDNIFDDIDDIFTGDIKIPTKEANRNTKSIFDDDDNDLFSDIDKNAQETTKDTKATDSRNNKSIFDSDDELFSDVNVTKSDKEKPKTIETESQISKPSVSHKTGNENNNNDTTTSKQPASIFDAQNLKDKPKVKSKSIFDSDSDDDLFTDKITNAKNKESTKNVLHETESGLFEENNETEKDNKLKTGKAKVFHSPSLFEEDEIDDLFINANKARIANVTSQNTILEHVIPEDIPDIINKVDVTKEIPAFSDKSNMDENYIEQEVEIQKPVIVDTKPYVFPKIDEPEPKPNKLFDDEDNLFTKHIETRTNSKVVEDDIIETSQEPTEEKNKNSSIGVAIDSKLQEPVSNAICENNGKDKVAVENEIPITEALDVNFADTNESTSRKLNAPLFEEVPVNEKEDLIPEQKKPISIAASFDDIFSEPPAFEKTKETKKTINVNALFEDDSDDEALFFKKNDVISDEKPDIFTSNVNFGLFNDEPPALVEADSAKATENVFDDNNLFSSIPNTTVNSANLTNIPPILDEWNDYPKDEPIVQSEKSTQEMLHDNLKCSSSVTETKTVKIINEAKTILDSDDELFNNLSLPEKNRNEKTLKDLGTKKVIDRLNDVTKDKTEIDKKIGKLNTKSFNINVQALVPGASPKKIPKERANDLSTDKDSSDFKNSNIDIEQSKKIEESISEVDNAEPKQVKSISFENKPESGVLDNNVSKQRAKIQVKRRPSSRRARHEAVRNSVIDLDDDTDNSSSFDEPLPITSQNIHSKLESNKHIQNEPKTVADKFDNINKEVNEKVAQTEKLSELNINTDNNHKGVIIGDTKDDNPSKNLFNIHDEITKDKVNCSDVVDSTKALNVDRNELSIEVAESKPIKDPVTENNSQRTTKVVYILNDEDIFSNKTEKPNLGVKDDMLQKTNESDDDLFKNKEIKTIGNTYKEVNTRIETTTTKTYITTDNKPSKKTQAKDTIKKEKDPPKQVQPKKEAKSLFDLSDDDDELFGKSNKTKKVEIKSKLFESDSEEDLFSGKKKGKEVKKEAEVQKAKDVKKASLFGDDDDDDLFGVKTKTALESSNTTSKATTSKEVNKSTEAVFDDPLSMLGDD